jgi:hypothetical protein
MPAVSIRQCDLFYLPNKGRQDAILTYDMQDTTPTLDAEPKPEDPALKAAFSPLISQRGSSDYGSQDTYDKLVSKLVFACSSEICLRKKMDIKENLSTKEPIGCSFFQRLLKKGKCLGVGISPNCQHVALLTQKMDVVVHSRVAKGLHPARTTYCLEPINKSMVQDFNPLDELLKSYPHGTKLPSPSDEQFNIYINDDASSVFLVSKQT